MTFWKSASTDDFHKVAETVSAKELNYFFIEWIESSGAPEFKLEYTIFRTQKGFRVMGKIAQDLDTFRMPVQLKIETEGNPEEKSVEVVGTLRAYRDQAAIIGPHAKPGFSINGQVGDNHQDAVVAVAEVLNQFRHGFTEGGLPEYAEAFRDALNDLMAKHWQEGT